jgi:hypothetical protein
MASHGQWYILNMFVNIWDKDYGVYIDGYKGSKDLDKFGHGSIHWKTAITLTNLRH